MKNRYDFRFAALFLIAFSFIILIPNSAEAQLERERAVSDPPESRLFWAPVNIGVSTVENMETGNLNTSIAHTFGLTNGGVDHFFGLDDGANTRIGLDYGITDNFSLGIGRMTFNKVVDIRGKANIFRQTRSGSTPLDLAVKASLGISTLSGLGLEFSDRLSSLVSIMGARKINRFSIQISPMFAWFHTVAGNNPDTLFGIGMLAQYELSERLALSAEYLPVIGNRHAGTSATMGVALNIDTGGHIFQLFFTSSQWHNEQFLMANNRDRFWEGDFRLGFNIHRVFGLGGR